MKPYEIIIHQPTHVPTPIDLPKNFDTVYAFHQSLDGYQKTPLLSLEALAKSLHIKGLYVKDESHRFGLNAFKGLGASYAVHEILKSAPEGTHTFVSCTDGNHGKALAWRAQQLGHNAIIFMPKGSEERRIKAIEAYGAKVIVTEMNYDDTVRHAAEYAEAHQYYLVQDTVLPNYTEVPGNVVAGYTTMVQEALEQIPEKPTHVFLQAGVGSMAGGVIWYLYNKYGDEMPTVGILEASSVACIYESVKQNRDVAIGGEPYTAMAGLNCGESNAATFPLIKALAQAYIKCEDDVTFKGMHRAKHPVAGDPKFSSGESSAVGLGFVEMLLSTPDDNETKHQLKIDENAVVLLFSTEGELIE